MAMLVTTLCWGVLTVFYFLTVLGMRHKFGKLTHDAPGRARQPGSNGG